MYIYMQYIQLQISPVLHSGWACGSTLNWRYEIMDAGSKWGTFVKAGGRDM